MDLNDLIGAARDARGGVRCGVTDHFKFDETGALAFPCCICFHASFDLKDAPCEGCCHYNV